MKQFRLGYLNIAPIQFQVSGRRRNSSSLYHFPRYRPKMTIRLLRSISCISVSEKKREKKVTASLLLRGCSHITSALFWVSGHPWWCCKHWSAFANPWYIIHWWHNMWTTSKRKQQFFQHILFQWSKVNVDISHFLAVTKGIIMNISHIWCQTMLELGWFLCLLWIFIRHQLFDEPLVP